MLALDKNFHRYRKRVCVQWGRGWGRGGKVHKHRKIPDNREDFEFCRSFFFFNFFCWGGGGGEMGGGSKQLAGNLGTL